MIRHISPSERAAEYVSKAYTRETVTRTSYKSLGTLGFYFADTEVPRLEGPPATLWRGKPPTDPPEARSRAGATLYLP